MGRICVSVDIEVELEAPDPGRAFVAVLETIAQEIGAAAEPLRSAGSAAGTDGRVAWRVSAFVEEQLTTCVACGRRVPRTVTDVREDGEVCRDCALAGAIGEHIERSAEDAFRDGVFTGAILSDGPVGGAVEGTLINTILKRRHIRR